MDMGLRDKVAVVSGAARGVGRAIVLALAAEGARVAIADIDANEAKRVVEQVEKAGGRALVIRTDVSKSGQVKAMVEEVLGTFGRIDILVNNAGVVGPQGPWADLSDDGFDLVVGVNLKGTYLCSQAVTAHMIARKSGKIINIASCAAKTGEPFNGIYSATKAAIVNLTQSMALELASHNINVNALCPAAMETRLMEKVYRERSRYVGLTPEEFGEKTRASFPLPNELTVVDVAHLVVFLASDRAKMMTGQAINITGGLEVH